MSLIRVIEIPESTGNFHFSGGERQAFVEVDWFRDENPLTEELMMNSEEGRDQIAEFIKAKWYFNPSKAYLILHESHSFTIGYSAP